MTFNPLELPEPDKRLRALELARKAWQECRLLDWPGRLDWARELHGYELFSTHQLAKICRSTGPGIRTYLKANAPGGRFQPITLGLLIQVRKLVIVDQHVSRYLLEQIHYGGTSISCAAWLTGADPFLFYRTRNKTRSKK